MIKRLLGCSLLITSFIVVAQDLSQVVIKTEKAAGDVYMLTGSGGNIAILATQKGLLLVDDQFQPLATKIEEAMKALSHNELKYIVNTHYHGDHVGSNKHFSNQAPIFAHENVRTRLSAKADHHMDSLPVVTYKDGVNIHLENEIVQLTHLPSGHTDGDTAVYFKQANVLHTGDLFFEVGFPYIDLNGGGSVKGYLNNINYLIANTPDDVVIIPGHGKLSNKSEYRAFAKMIDYSIKLVSKALAEGQSESEILKAGIGEQYEDQSWAFINEERWLKTLIKDLQ